MDWATSYRETRYVKVNLGWSRIIWRLVCSLSIVSFISFKLFKDGNYVEYAPNGQTSVSPDLDGNITTFFTKEDLESTEHLDLYNRYWDAEDSIYTIQESSFFVATNMIITPNQRRCVCKTECTSNNCCMEEKQGENATWCPPEIETLPSTKNAVFQDSIDFTVFLQNSVYFPKHELSITTRNKRRNNTFKIKEIVIGALTDPRSELEAEAVNNITLYGAVIKIEINRQCVLPPWYRGSSESAKNWLGENCKPDYNFILIKENWEVKTTHYYHRDEFDDNEFKQGQFRRYLYTYRGINFKIDFHNKVGQWDFMTIILNLMGGLAIFTSLEWAFKYIASGLCCSKCLIKSRWFPSTRSTFRQFNDVEYERVKVTIVLKSDKLVHVYRRRSWCHQKVVQGFPVPARPLLQAQRPRPMVARQVPGQTSRS